MASEWGLQTAYMGINNQTSISHLQTLIRPPIRMPHLHINRAMNHLITDHILLTLCPHNITSALHRTINSTPLSPGAEYLALVCVCFGREVESICIGFGGERGEFETTGAELARAGCVASLNGGGVFGEAPEETGDGFEILVEHREAGADEAGVGFDNGPVRCWYWTDCGDWLDLVILAMILQRTC